MEMRNLGKGGPLVSRLCFGTLTLSPLQRNLSPLDGARLLIHARERGVNFLDTAEFYDNYAPIRIAAKEIPDLVICTKSYCYDEETAQKAFEKALKEMGREYIDLFLLHEQESIHTLRGHEGALRYLTRQKEKGYIGKTGVSTHFVSCVKSARLFPYIDVIMPLINMSGIGVPDGTAEDMALAAQEAHDAGIGIYGMKALGGGSLISNRDAALDYVLRQPFLDSIAVGMQSREEIDINCDIFEGRKPEAKDEKKVADIPRRLIIDNWCEGCGACVKRCRQHALSLVNGKSTVDREKCALCGYCASVCPVFAIKII